MKMMIITLLLTVGGAAYLARPHATQTSSLMIRFEVDGKEVLDPKFKVLIDVDGYQIEPDYTRQGFVVPKEVGTGQEINVRFKSGEYELFFPSIKSHNFDTEWI